MSAIPKPKPLSKNQIINSLTEVNAKLNEDLTLLADALKKEQEGEIKLPYAPSVGQLNRVIEWCQKFHDYYHSVKQVPTKVDADS